MPDVTAVVSAFGIGSAVGSVVTLLVEHQLVRLSEKRRRRIATDRATYHERMTQLIAGNLYALIHSDRYREGDREQLEELVQNLSDGAHRPRFLDPKVQRAWVTLLERSAECGWRRLADNVVTEREIAQYTQAREAWEHAARESFGPLGKIDAPVMRRSDARSSTEEAA